MLRRIIAFAVLLAAASPAAARDSLGNYVSVGFGKCPEFLKDMATAKQRGGAETSAGLVVMANYISYVQGFRTAFNAEAEGIVDILSSMGKDSVVNALYTIERWCTQNPDKDFADAVISWPILCATNLRKTTFPSNADPKCPACTGPAAVQLGRGEP